LSIGLTITIISGRAERMKNATYCIFCVQVAMMDERKYDIDVFQGK
jgi:hypothetical protein